MNLTRALPTAKNKMISRLSRSLTRQSQLQRFNVGISKSGKLNNPFDDSNYKFTYDLKFLTEIKKLETFRIIDLNGKVVSKDHEHVDKDLLLTIYKKMIQTEIIDDILLKAQRQGKISFYMTSFGETATTIGVPAGLKPTDEIFTQYREHGAFIYRGFTIDQMIAQCAGNKNDPASGRQMPVHYSAKSLNIHCVSSPLATQIPQAAGAGYAFRISGEDKIAVAFFGEGTTSEGDFHSAMNFGATLDCQTLFICRNNKYAISTHMSDQFKGDGLAARGLGYGMKTIRVDGNDALAIVQATKYAREYIVKEKKPVFMEAMTYRIGDHSTSDYSALYRELDEIESWKKDNDPINRLGKYLKLKGWMPYTDAQVQELRNQILDEVKASLKKQSETQLPSISKLFEQVYDKPTENLLRQKQELLDVIKAYPDLIDVSRYSKE